jgi:SepF-like predicted cell division protein (DUF552 family)
MAAQISLQNGLCYTKLSGQISMKEAAELLLDSRTKMANEVYIDLVELENDADVRFKVSEIREMADVAGAATEVSFAHYIVIVARNGIHYGLGKIFQAIVDSRCKNTRVDIFKDIGEARAHCEWVQQQKRESA